MRILHVTESLDPVRGGPPMVAARLAAAQAALSQDVHLLCRRVPGAEARIGSTLAAIPGVDRVRVHEAPLAAGRVGRAVDNEARRTLAPLIGTFDLVHLHEVWRPIVRVTAGMARRAGVPYLVAPHSTLSSWSLA